MADLLASASSLDGIRESVSRFYCGESKTLIPTSDNAWKVTGTHSGKDCPGVRVVRKGRRFRFEMLAA